MRVDVQMTKPRPESVTLTMTFEEARDLYHSLSKQMVHGPALPESYYRVLHSLIRSAVPPKVGDE